MAKKNRYEQIKEKMMKFRNLSSIRCNNQKAGFSTFTGTPN